MKPDAEAAVQDGQGSGAGAGAAVTSRTVDGWLLGAGTFLAIRVPMPRVVDRRAARTALLTAPLWGAVVGFLGGAIGAAAWWLVSWRHGGNPYAAPDATVSGAGLIAASLAVVTQVLLTRAMHLDGLADTVDGLGSARTGAAALAVMRDPRLGAFGTLALISAVLLQVASLTLLFSAGPFVGWGAVVVAAMAARATLAFHCRAGTPADDSGLGRTVVGSASGSLGLAAGVGWTAVAILVGALAGLQPWWVLAIAGAMPWLVGGYLRRLALRRFGVVTGDLLGALIEVGATAALLALALLI